MKKILVALNLMGHGGVPRALINFLVNMKGYADVDLLLFREDGVVNNQIPEGTNVIVPNGLMDVFIDGRQYCKKLGLKKYLFRCLMGVWTKLFKSNNLFVNYAVRHSEKLKTHYDVAISYNGVIPNGSPWRGVAEYILRNVSATKKLAVTHDDYVSEYYKKHSIKMYNKFDLILAVSKSCRDIISKKVPELAGKFDYCYNFCDIGNIKNKLKGELPEFLPGFNVVTCCHIEPRKGVDMAIRAFKRLTEEGYNINYNILGTGPQEEELKRFAKEHNLTNVVFHGFNPNPFSYVKRADLSLLPSLREAAPMVYAESFYSGTPILSTRTISADELVSEFGYVCDISEEGIYGALKQIIEDKEGLKKKTEALKNYNYPNDKIREKWLRLFE